MTRKFLVAMSGGVDSSVAAYLIKKQYPDSAAVTMRQLRGFNETGSCCSWSDLHDAAEAAFALGIPHAVLDFTDEFRREVIDEFVRVYESGGTPNPCLYCNRRMRSGHLLSYALSKGFDGIATGHYAKIKYDSGSNRWLLMRGADRTKDQAYVHYAMTQFQLEHTVFPLGELAKADVREIAENLGLVTANKRDSQDICFVPDGDYGAFMERYTGKKYESGDFLDLDGNVIGHHRGAVRYTIGQRRGLSLPMGERVYVVGKDMEKNTVTVGDESALYSKSLVVSDVNWIAFENLTSPLNVTVQTRYRQKERSAKIIPLSENTVRVNFEEPHRAAALGQAAVFYDGDIVLGGGIISSNPK